MSDTEEYELHVRDEHIASLKAEVARLREENDIWKEARGRDAEEFKSLRAANAELAGGLADLAELEAANCRVELISWRIAVERGPPKLLWSCLVYAKKRRGEELTAQNGSPLPLIESIAVATAAARAALAKHKETTDAS